MGSRPSFPGNDETATKLGLTVSFADSGLKGYRRDEDVVTVEVVTDDLRAVKVMFQGVLTLRDRLAGEFSALVQSLPASHGALEEALRLAFVAVPADHEYEAYSFLDLDECLLLEAVAASCEVVVEDDKV